VFKFLVEECLPSDEEWTDSFSGNSLALFMIEASCENSAVSVIYHLLKRNVHDAFQEMIMASVRSASVVVTLDCGVSN
jgi:hypothetical protein